MKYAIITLMMFVTIFSTFSMAATNAHARPNLATAANQNLSSVPQQATVNYTTIAAEAYIFGYPLMTMYITEKVLTNVPAPLPSGDGAPIGQFANKPDVPNANFTAVVAPNADTLYSTAFLNLSKGPMVLNVPDTRGRYYLMPMLDAWTDVFASPGKRTTGTAAGNFLIEGPNWKGTVPSGIREIKSPTSMLWVIGRTEVNSTSRTDIAAVNAIQKQYKLTPLSGWGTNYTAPSNMPTDPTVDMKTPPLFQVNNMANDPDKYFNLMAQLMVDNPPYAADAPMMTQLAQVGIVPGKPFDWNGFSPQVQSQILAGTKAALARLQDLVKAGGASGTSSKLSKMANGWVLTYGLGNYTNIPSVNPNTFEAYALRAYVSYVGLGANLAADAMYPQSRQDIDGQPYSGQNRYLLHFNTGQTPPYNGFWSLTMYNNDGFFIANSINRYAIGNRNPLKYNADGSLDIYIQNVEPGADKRSNWLPAPTGAFYLVLRVYWPQQAMTNGLWIPTGVKSASTSTSTRTISTETAPSNTTTVATGLAIIVLIALGVGLYLRRQKRPPT